MVMLRAEKAFSFLNNSYVRALIILALVASDLSIFVLPYIFHGYAVPVGWDKSWYIRNMRLIEEQGLLNFFQEVNQVNFFSVLEYAVASVFNISFMLTATIVPIISALGFMLVNFQITKNLSQSWRLSLFAMFLTIIDYNILRMVGVSVDRNLFCFLLTEAALFLVLPKLLDRPSTRVFGLFVLLQVLAGLSQIETFAVSSVVLTIFLILYIHSHSFQKGKIVILCIFVPLALIILINSPYIPEILRGHIVTNPSNWPWRRPENMIAHPLSYFLSLGSGLVLFFVVGFYATVEALKSRDASLPLLLSLWNVVIFISSFAPLAGLRIPAWRLLLLATTPPIVAVGVARFFAKETLTTKRILAVLILTAITCTAIVLAHRVTYKPWISNEEYGRLQWIANHKQNSSLTFVLYYDKGEMSTYGWADLHRRWVWSIIGTRSNVYFGEVDYLLNSKPTTFEKWYANYTSFAFWSEMKNFSLDDGEIYLISDWYEASLNKQCLREVNDGIYRIETD